MNVAQQVYESMTRFNPNFALIDTVRAVTYRQLFSVVRNVQGQLIVGEPVGIYHEPSVLFGIASVACLLKGCPIVPIDTALPESSVRNVVGELGIKTVFATDDDSSVFGEAVEIIDTQELLKRRSAPFSFMDIAQPCESDAIYSVSTSGTTGHPKCIPVTHSSAFESYRWREHYLPYRPNQRVAIHIFAIWELFRPLIHGGCCVFPGRDNIGSIDKLCGFLDTYKVDEMLFTPSYIEMLCDLTVQSGASTRSYPKRIVLNGEPVTRDLIDKISTVFPSSDVWNLYSISEAHDISIEKVSGPDVDGTSHYVVGAPMPHITAYVFDDNGSEVQIGEEGELYLEGDKMLGPGYVNRPAETRQRFVKTDVGGTLRRLYKTGDRGQLTASGKLRVIGRSEHMLKRRGFSIQSDDLVESLRNLMEFDQGVPWIVTQNKRQWLVFYYTARESQRQGNAQKWQLDNHQWAIGDVLKDMLLSVLPEYCIPDYFMALETLPIHAVSGKCDFKALPAPEAHFHSAQIIEQCDGFTQFKQQWSQILKRPVDSIDMRQTFRRNGGDSLAQIELGHLCAERWNVDLSFDQLSDCTGVELYFVLTGLTQEHGFNNTPLPERRGILLTGATGYVGRHVLRALLPLLDDSLCVYCLIRPKKESARQRLLHTISKRSPHVFAVEGDISKELFGLTTTDYEQLANNTFCVVHCASLVNLVLDEKMLHNDVVLGSNRIISFCQLANAVLHFTSTSAVAPNHGGPYAESLFHQCDPGTGYGRTKQQVENEIVRSGLRHSIYRLPSMFCAESPNRKDLYTAILKVIGRSAAFPLQLCFQLSNIRAVSQFMARAARSGRHDGVLNLMSNKPISLNIRHTALIVGGFECMASKKWVAQMPVDNPYKRMFQNDTNVLFDTACFENNRAMQAWGEVMETPYASITVTFDDWFGSLSDSEYCDRSVRTHWLTAAPELA